MKENLKAYDIIIIGGGVSGITLAHKLAKMDKNVLILEKKKLFGGAIEALKYEDFTIELGAHTAYNSYSSLIDMLVSAGLDKEITQREKQKYFFISPKGKLQKLSKGLNFLSLFFHLPRIFLCKKQGYTVSQYYGKIMGKKNYKNFGRHFFKAVLSQNADNFPADFVLKIRKNRNKLYPRSFTTKGGLQTFIDGLMKIPNIKSIENYDVCTIHKKSNKYIINNQFIAHKIAFATPAITTASLCKGILPQLSKVLEHIKYKTISSLGIIIDTKNCDLPFISGLITAYDDFTSIVSRDVLPHHKYRGFTIHAQGILSKEKLTQQITELININPQMILKSGYKQTMLPQLNINHQSIIDDIESILKSHKNILVTGNYFEGLSLEDCVNRSLQELYRTMN